MLWQAAEASVVTVVSVGLSEIGDEHDFKSGRKTLSEGPNIEPIPLDARRYVGPPTHDTTPCYFLSRFFYKNYQKWLRRPIFKFTRIDVTPNGFASNSNSDLLDVLARYPRPRPHHHRLRSMYYKFY